MASYAEQLRLADAARIAVASIEAVARQSIVNAFASWDAEELTGISVRWALERTIREAYRDAAAVGFQHAVQNSGLEEWRPAEVFNTAYLQTLIMDVRRNLREYKASERTEKDRARHISRIQHSAGVAAQRGYTDQLIASYKELADFGYKLRKIWLANFVDNVPCPVCRKLHGTEVGLNDQFRVESGEPGVYIDLVGPPRHPRCQCKIVVLVESLETALTPLVLPTPPPAPNVMSTDDVKRMPKGIFRAVIAALQAVKKFMRRNRG